LAINTYKVACRVGKEQQIWHIAAKDFEAARQSALANVEGCKAAVVLVQALADSDEESPLDTAA
jgi:hypothetical protein